MTDRRIARGVEIARLERRAGRPWHALVNAQALEDCLHEEYVNLHAGRITATKEGRMRLDALLPLLLA
jgi:oxygen-independent coproporphyrinogen-3 oxidase